MKTRNMKTIVGSHPIKKGVEEEGIYLPHRLLTVFKVFIIYFSTNIPHHAEWNHLPNSFTLRTIKLPSPTSEEISHSTRHDPR
jgi:hypothetical protein